MARHLQTKQNVRHTEQKAIIKSFSNRSKILFLVFKRER